MESNSYAGLSTGRLDLVYFRTKDQASLAAAAARPVVHRSIGVSVHRISYFTFLTGHPGRFHDHQDTYIQAISKLSVRV